MNVRLLITLIAFRCVNAIIVQTYFNPDEFWQSVEVAHFWVYGYGELTWEWKEQLRGWTHPFVFALIFWLLKLFSLDVPFLIQWIPRLFQGIMAGLSDFFVYCLAFRLGGEMIAKWSLCLQCFSWFIFYSSVR